MGDTTKIAKYKKIIKAIEDALEQNAGGAGVVSVSIDGISTNYSFQAAVEQLNFWEKRLQKELGTRRLISTINLQNS